MNITNIEPKTDVKGKDYLLVTADGTKMGCWETKIFPTLKTAYANGTPIDLITKVNGKYTLIMGVGKAGATNSPASATGHLITPPAPTQFNGQEIGCILNNACDLLGKSIMPEGKLPTQEDILSTMITIWKSLTAFKLKISEKPIEQKPPETEDQDEIPNY